MTYQNYFPDLSSRNYTQFWVWLNRESAIKQGTEPSVVSNEIDSAFNLTISYRSDSDVIRHSADIESVLWSSRLSEETGELLFSDEKFFEEMMSKKNTSKYHTVWLVSDCDHTPGALLRWEYGKKLIIAGLKLHGEGKCFDVSFTKFLYNKLE